MMAFVCFILLFVGARALLWSRTFGEAIAGAFAMIAGIALAVYLT